MMEAVGAHIFAGGFTIGVRRAGFDARVHLEDGTYGAEIATKNLGVKTHTDRASWPSVSGVPFVYANPPCVGWSAANKAPGKQAQRAGLEAAKGVTFGLRDLLGQGPTVLATESVPGVRREFPRFQSWARDFGYNLYLVKVDTSLLGAPQRRLRYFVVWSRVALDFPKPSMPVVTVRDAWGDIQHDDVYNQMPENTRKAWNLWKDSGSPPVRGLHHWGERLGVPVPFLAYVAGLDYPAPTFICADRMYHPLEPRTLNVAESKAICAYPQNFDIHLDRKPSVSHTRYLGRSVLPPAGEWLAERVRAGLEAQKGISEPATYLVDVVKGTVQKWL